MTLEREPRNSAEIAIKLFDKARELGHRARVECSLVGKSDSRYVIINIGGPREAVIRISSHRPYENRYSLCLDIHTRELLRTATARGSEWLEKNYDTDSEIETPPEWGGSPASDFYNRRSRRSRHLLRPDRDIEAGGDSRYPHRIRCGGARGVRIAGQEPKRVGRKPRNLRHKWPRNN